MTIEGLVADVLTNRELAINRGAKHGVEIGMRFRILANRGTDIRDPETGEILGTVEILKTVVKIVDVKENLSVGRTFRTLRQGSNSFGSQSNALTELFKPSTTVIETLEVDGRFSRAELTPEESYVKLGDRAVQIVRSEDDPIDSITVNSLLSNKSPFELAVESNSRSHPGLPRYIANRPALSEKIVTETPKSSSEKEPPSTSRKRLVDSKTPENTTVKGKHKPVPRDKS